jgi:hypothetical protein
MGKKITESLTPFLTARRIQDDIQNAHEDIVLNHDMTRGGGGIGVRGVHEHSTTLKSEILQGLQGWL